MLLYTDMRQIGSRQFQRHYYEEIKNLPFMVVSNGKPIIVVTRPDIDNTSDMTNDSTSTDNVTDNDMTNDSTEEWQDFLHEFEGLKKYISDFTDLMSADFLELKKKVEVTTSISPTTQSCQLGISCSETMLEEYYVTSPEGVRKRKYTCGEHMTKAVKQGYKFEDIV